MAHHASPDEELLALAAQGKIRLGEGLVEEFFWKMPAPRVPRAALQNAIRAERDDAEAQAGRSVQMAISAQRLSKKALR